MLILIIVNIVVYEKERIMVPDNKTSEAQKIDLHRLIEKNKEIKQGNNQRRVLLRRILISTVI